MKLFYFYIGGRTEKSLVELHDVRFGCGAQLEDTFDALRQSWWGVPDSLRRRMALFRHSGIVEPYRDGLFTPPSWLSVYIGQGLTPEHYSPLADVAPLSRTLKGLEGLREDIRDRVDELPKHSTFLARYADVRRVDEALLHEAEVRL